MYSNKFFYARYVKDYLYKCRARGIMKNTELT